MAWECAQTSVKCASSHVISNRKVLYGILQPCEIPAWPTRRDHFWQETAHFSSQGLLQFLQNEPPGEHYLKNKVRKKKSLGMVHLIWYAQPIQSQCRWYHPMDVHWASKGVAIIIMRLCTCMDKLERWETDGGKFTEMPEEHEQDNEADKRMGRPKAAFPYNTGCKSQRSLNRGQSPAIR